MAGTGAHAAYTGLAESVGVVAEVEALRERMAGWLAATDAAIRAPLEWQLDDASKLFRPVTLFACWRATGCPFPRDEAVSRALAIELFHNVTLVVDDILDRSRYRRRKLTLHCRFGTLPALMTSGYLTAAAFDLVADRPREVGLLAELMRRLALAECEQWRMRRQPAGLEDWRRLAGEDTGVMFEMCAALGSNGSTLRPFGYLLGSLYHGCDDVADIREASALGEGGEADLRDGILTLPAALALDDAAVARLFAATEPEAVPALRAALLERLPAAEQQLDALAGEALATLVAGQESPDGRAEVAAGASGDAAFVDRVIPPVGPPVVDPEPLQNLVRLTRALSGA